MTMKLYCPSCDSRRIIKLPIEKGLHLCPDCSTRHYLTDNLDWCRDVYGETQWAKMASYAGKTYEQVVAEEYAYHTGVAK